MTYNDVYVGDCIVYTGPKNLDGCFPREIHLVMYVDTYHPYINLLHMQYRGQAGMGTCAITRKMLEDLFTHIDEMPETAKI